jgi:uncharacterized membrane protein YecN with MAPEG domain
MDSGVGFAGQAAALWAGLNLLVLIALSALTVRQRQRHRIAVGDDGVPELVRAQRAFGNASEYIPAGLAALAILTVAGAPAPLVHLVGALLLLGRIVHAVGLSLTAGPSIGRTVGMLLTWIALLLAAFSLVVFGI